MSWGPSHQPVNQPNHRRRFGLAVCIVWLILIVLDAGLRGLLVTLGFYAVVIRILMFAYRWLPARTRLRVRILAVRIRHRLPIPALPHRGRASSGRLDVGPLPAGVHLGVGGEGGDRRSTPERAVLVLGPPRSGKTSGVIIPTILQHAGPVISTSTKPDVLRATHTHRAQAGGQVWQFDPTGTSPPVEGVQTLRWSPVLCSTDWDGALLMARAMVTGSQVGSGTTDANHWTRRAQALLAPMLHAAAVSGRQMSDVVSWVMRHEIDEPGALLTEHGGADLAIGQLIGLQNTEARERSSILSAAADADALDAYTSHAALDAASHPNFFAGRFVTSRDTIYITAPAEHQQLTAPLVCGLISEIRRETYTHHRDGTLHQPVLFALDEVANVAPITELPQIASEGASQGILLLAALQDLSQARARWGTAADGFLTLFGTKLILPGIADHKTLDTISTALGEYDRRVVSHTTPQVSFLDNLLSSSKHPRPHNSTTTSTQRTRRLSPGDIARIPAGKALHLDGLQWELVALTPAHLVEPWRTLTTAAAPVAGR
jgi:type IV secretion system protein VirD4